MARKNKAVMEEAEDRPVDEQFAQTESKIPLVRETHLGRKLSAKARQRIAAAVKERRRFANLPIPDPEVELAQRATDVIGADRISRWMQTPIPSLNNEAPYSLLRTEAGRKRVGDTLTAIEHGIF
jgi:putative toxin-antitoxin system antitoxin component (TIGR02293 family)